MWPFWWKGPSGFSPRSTAEQVTQGIDATGLTAIVTGASSGIGTETTRVLALRGAHVVMAVRNVESGRKVKEEILKEFPTAKIDVMHLDLNSMESVRKFASEFISLGLPLNLLINNAGIMAAPFMLSQDNIEMQFATNHVGHFLLTDLVLDTMKKTALESDREGRIVILSSEAHRFTYSEGIRFDKINDESGYNSIWAYGQSKLANVLHANELTRRLKEEGVNITANSLHPGAIMTNLLRFHSVINSNSVVTMVGRFALKNVQQGAATTCYVTLHPQVKGVSGEYFMDSNLSKASSLAKDVELAKKLWDFSLSLTNPKYSEPANMGFFGKKGPSGFSSSSTAEEVTEGIDGSGLTAIVTGASSGIGTETARVLALRGVHVVMAVRNVDSGNKVREEILKEIPSAKVEVMELDLCSMSSVREFASKYNSSGFPLNILINNAGIMASPYLLSKDNIELQFATNYLSHFLLTNLLLDNLKNTARESNREGRIVNLSSSAHRHPFPGGIRFDTINDEAGYGSIKAYGQSKLATLLHANELARRFKEEGVNITANSLHPGGIHTNLFRYHTVLSGFASTVGRFMFKTVPQGAATTCYVALHPQVNGVSGKYFEDCNISKSSAYGQDAELAKKLWDFSLPLTNP
ncbi:hypothetical protein POTOM_012210 [Populus tomentosa]|uniref:NAD(P)-binding Rossmann-fold superfamily protein n=1 Tax=Populus tomentosa TaxID=118781 RepID=A0A8X8AAA3_POPTO|nr:hypothetical protein POTOM_012210 [Populus tomentosa]